MAQKTIQERAVENTLDDIRILDELSCVTDGSIVLYPSEEKLAANLSEIGYDMPGEGMYTVEEFLDRIGTDRTALRWMSEHDITLLLFDLTVQACACSYDEINANTRQALIERFTKRIDDMVS